MQPQARPKGDGASRPIQFARKKGGTLDGAPKEPWKVLIIDDEPEVHEVTRLALGRYMFQGRPLAFHGAYSAEEGRQLLVAHPDAAVLLLDVVMETDEAGLELVPYIREELRNSSLRIILRTGQPGQAPERRVIADYDINDYKEKSDLTAQKMFTAVLTALRSHRDLKALEATRSGLEAVIEASATIFQERSMELFAQGVLEQLVALLELSPNAFYCQLGALATRPVEGGMRVIAATGEFSPLIGEDACDHLDERVVALIDRAMRDRRSQFHENMYVGYVETSTGERNLLFLRGEGLDEMEADSLVRLYFRNVSIAFDNLHLHSNLVREVDTRRQREEENAVLARIPEEAPMPVLRVAEDGRLIYANGASHALLDAWGTEIGGAIPADYMEVLGSAMARGEPVEFEISQGDRTLEAVLTPVREAGYVNMYCKDVTDTWRVRAELEFMATHDDLTRLPNRALFLDHLQTEMGAARRTGRSVAVSFLDLDNFKTVNDTLGHHAGDELLRQVADRLREAVRGSDLVARLGGDEFAVLQPSLTDPTVAEHQARRIIQSLSEPIPVEGRPVQVGCSIGITTFPSDAESAAKLQQNADMAMYLAKSKGRNCYRFYDSELDSRIQRQRELENAMRDGLAGGEFAVFYQPKIDLAEGRVVGAEALLRWIRAGEGHVSPGEFIPAAEKNGFITELGAWVLRQACAQVADWSRRNLNVGGVAVNLSPVQFRDRDLADLVHESVAGSGLSPELLELEITESLAMEDVGETAAVMNRLKDSGVGLAIDDFGTGYSSLSYLRKLPFTKIKIDRSFILDVDEDEEACSIVQTIVSLAHNLNLRVVAEGIERDSQAGRLKAFGCDEAQGFLYSRPVPADQFERFLTDWPSHGEA